VSIPIISRLYSPNSFGIATYYGSIISILLIVSSLKYPKAIYLPKENKKTQALVLGSLLVGIVNIFIISIAILFFGKVLFFFIGMPEIVPYLWIIPISLILNSWNTIIGYYIKRKNHFGIVALGAILGSIISITVKVGVGYFYKGDAIGLIWGNISAVIIALSISILMYNQNTNSISNYLNVHFSSLKNALFEYRMFPKYQVLISLLNLLSKNGVPLFLGLFYDSSIIGSYGMAYFLIRLPVSLFVTSVSEVFYKYLSGIDIMENTIISLLKFLLTTIFVPVVVLASFGREIIITALGNTWVTAGIFSQYMAIILFFSFCIAPLNSVFIVKSKQRLFFFNNLILLAMTIASILIGNYFNSANLVILLISIAFGVSHFIMGKNIFTILNIDNTLFYKYIFSYATGIGVFVVLILAIKSISFPLSIIVTSITSIIFVYRYMLKDGNYQSFLAFMKAF